MGVGLSSQGGRDRARGNGLTLYEVRVRLDIEENFCTERVVRHWKSCPGSWGSQYPWKGSKTCGYELVEDLEVLGSWVDSISDGFSSLNNPGFCLLTVVSLNLSPHHFRFSFSSFAKRLFHTFSQRAQL